MENNIQCEHLYDENGLCVKCNRLQTPEEYEKDNEVCEGCGEPILENESHADGRHSTCL